MQFCRCLPVRVGPCKGIVSKHQHQTLDKPSMTRARLALTSWSPELPPSTSNQRATEEVVVNGNTGNATRDNSRVRVRGSSKARRLLTSYSWLDVEKTNCPCFVKTLKICINSRKTGASAVPQQPIERNNCVNGANRDRTICHVLGRIVLMAYGIPRLKKNRLILQY